MFVLFLVYFTGDNEMSGIIPTEIGLLTNLKTSESPTCRPTTATANPTIFPTKYPTKRPTRKPTIQPTRLESNYLANCGGHTAKDCGSCPWNGDIWMAGSWCNGDCVWMNEECIEKAKPGEPTGTPTTANPNPTISPTKYPTKRPTGGPTRKPTRTPTIQPTRNPTKRPTKSPGSVFVRG